MVTINGRIATIVEEAYASNSIDVLMENVVDKLAETRIANGWSMEAEQVLTDVAVKALLDFLRDCKIAQAAIQEQE